MDGDREKGEELRRKNEGIGREIGIGDGDGKMGEKEEE